MSAHRCHLGDPATVLVGLLLKAEISLDLVVAKRRKRVLVKHGVVGPDRVLVPRRHRLDRKVRRIEIQDRRAS